MDQLAVASVIGVIGGFYLVSFSYFLPAWSSISAGTGDGIAGVTINLTLAAGCLPALYRKA